MKIAVRYFTRSGNTQKLAASIADAVGTKAENVSVPLTERIDILFLCSSPYAFDVDDAVKVFLRENVQYIGKMINCGTSASPVSAYQYVKKLAEELKIDLAEEEFHCFGSFLFMHRGRPDAEDLQKAAAFARKMIK